MSVTRRATILAFLASPLTPSQQPQDRDDRRLPPDRDPDEDARLPNGKSQKDAMSEQAHKDALKEIDTLIHLAEDLRDEMKRAGQYVVAVSSLKKTEEIEKLARQIRSKLKA